MEEPLRILVFTTVYPEDESDSWGIFSRHLVRHLAPMGQQLLVVAPSPLAPPPRHRQRPASIAKWVAGLQARGEPTVDGITVLRPRWLSLPKAAVGFHAYRGFATVRPRLLKTLEHFRADVTLAFWLPDVIAASTLAERLRTPLVGSCLGGDSHTWPTRYRHWEWARDRINERAAALIFPSEALKREALSIGLAPPITAVIPNGVDVNLFDRTGIRQTDSRALVLAVGDFIAVKGFDVLVEAFARLRARGRRARLRIVGVEHGFSNLRRLVEEWDLATDVDIKGFRPQAQLIKDYREATVLVVPSRAEGLPNVALEAMACGVPVVGSAVGGIPEILTKESGLLVPPDDVGSLTAALELALERDWHRDAIRNATVARHSWDATACAYVKVLQEARSQDSSSHEKRGS